MAAATSSRDQPLAGPQHRLQPLRAGHRREAQPVLRDARHPRLQAFERREIVLAQRDQHAVVAAREVEALGRRIVGFELRFQRLRRPVLHQVGQVRDEARGARAPELVGLREREDLFELVEDQQRNQRLAGLVLQHVVAMMQELPQRLAGGRDSGLRPLPGAARGLRDGLLDLLGRLRRIAGVVDAHIHRAIALPAQAGHQAGAQDRCLAEPRLAEQHREQLALHAARELGDFFLAAVEVAARLFGEGSEAEPRIACRRPQVQPHPVDGSFGCAFMTAAPA